MIQSWSLINHESFQNTATLFGSMWPVKFGIWDTTHFFVLHMPCSKCLAWNNSLPAGGSIPRSCAMLAKLRASKVAKLGLARCDRSYSHHPIFSQLCLRVFLMCIETIQKKRKNWLFGTLQLQIALRWNKSQQTFGCGSRAELPVDTHRHF